MMILGVFHVQGNSCVFRVFHVCGHPVVGYVVGDLNDELSCHVMYPERVHISAYAG